MLIVPLSNLPVFNGEENKEAALSAQGSSVPFSNVLQQAMNAMEESRQAAAQDSYQLAFGDAGDLHTMMINSAMETASIETVVQLTSRAVSAYKEIMQMQI